MNHTLDVLKQIEEGAPGTVRLLGSEQLQPLRLDPRSRPHSNRSLQFLSSLRPMIKVGKADSAVRLHAAIEQQLFAALTGSGATVRDEQGSSPRLSRPLGCFSRAAATSAFGVECRAAVGASPDDLVLYATLMLRCR